MKKIFKNPIIIILSAIFGAAFGFYYQKGALNIAFVGEGYLRLLQMCVVPILTSAIILGIGELTLNHKEKIKKIWWRIALSLTALIVIAALGIMGGHVMKPGDITDTNKRNEIGEIISNFDQIDLALSFNDINESNIDPPFSGLAEQIPNNIFESFLESKAIQLVIFSIIFGIAIGLLTDRRKSERLLKIFDSIFESFKKIIDLILLGLPIGLFCLISKQVAEIGLAVFSTMASFIFAFYIIGLIIIIIATLAISFFSKKPLILCIKASISPIVTAFSTRSSLATMPIASKALSQKLEYDEKSSNLFVSLLIPILRFGNILFFALAGIFFLQLYSKGIDGNISSLIFNSIIASFASIGSTGVLTLQPLSYVLSPLNLPVETAIVLLMAIDPIIDPLRTTIIVHSNTAIASFLAEKSKNKVK